MTYKKAGIKEGIKQILFMRRRKNVYLFKKNLFNYILSIKAKKIICF